MIYRFKSTADGDLIMMGPAGDAVLRLLGREPATKGIIEASALAASIATLETAVADDEAARKAAGAEGAAAAAGGGDKVSLRQRAWPLLEMMRRARAENADIVWGV